MKAYVVTQTIVTSNEMLVYADSPDEARRKARSGDIRDEWPIDDMARRGIRRVVRAPEYDEADGEQVQI